uniref:Biotin carboxyl carrier protein of acetyl-CoA carboxylase n=1 Tax=Thuretia quercifolia TaxID=189650 RepID=A0A1Z1MK31_9FLOR|nr:acetyl-CoA carboxylase biotin carboxyl carrier protein [Thuretia quercifolia]ARW66450.1 acetyl-CoA carboxylase biotin carboxyl carrier protein [Thuretia quercifolia]
MIFSLKDLKKFIYSIESKKIEQVNIKSNNLKILINKNKALTKLKSQNILEENYKIQNKQKISNKHYFPKTYSKNNVNQKNNNKTLIQDTILQQDESKTYFTIVSPMVGTFYRSPAPNEPSFIEKNDIVKKKQTICIIEAMKLMNEIESEVDGEISEILVNDGDIVDCGQALIKIKTI